MPPVHHKMSRLIDRSVYSVLNDEGTFDCTMHKVCSKCKNECSFHHDSCPSCNHPYVFFEECKAGTRCISFLRWLIHCRLTPTEDRDKLSCRDILSRIDVDFRAFGETMHRCSQGNASPLVSRKAKLKKDLEQVLKACEGLNIENY